MSAFSDALLRGLRVSMDRNREQATYAQGDVQVELHVIPGKEQFDTDSNGDIRLDSKSRSFVFFAEDLISETKLIPRRGDVITLTIGGFTESYEVQQGVRFNDSSNLQWRVSGRLISREETE